jgi:UDP-2-acetamido-3-amino-2,3-dideoxy-glucuronate N-acetyltransferase
MKNIAVIGCGYWGKNLVRNFHELGALHTICETDTTTLKTIHLGYPEVKTENVYSEVPKNPNIQGIVISTPAELHYQMAKQALEEDKDVFVEKPLALTVKEGEELVDLAKTKNRILMVGHLLEYHPAISWLKTFIDEGGLGKVNYIYSSRLNLGKFRTEENILWSFAPHDISVILSLLEQVPEEVNAFGGDYLNKGIVDVTVTTMGFKGGTKAHIFVSWLHPYKEQKLVVVGSRKTAVFDGVEETLKLYENPVEWINQIPTPNKVEGLQIYYDKTEPLRLECKHFLNCIESRQTPKTDGAKALEVLRVLERSQKSLGTTKDYYIHSSSIIESYNIGEGTKIWHFCHIMPGATIGTNCTLGQNTFIGKDVKIGNNVKIENNVSIFEGVTIENDVFIGPSVVFTNVKFPRSYRKADKFTPTLVKKGATIGANATIICGVTIGEYAFVGAGSIVTKDIPDETLVYGNPAEFKNRIGK